MNIFWDFELFAVIINIQSGLPLSLQVQQRVARSGQAQPTVSMPIQANMSLTMPFCSNPMMFSQTNTRSLQDTNQRHADGDFSQDGQLR